MFTLFRILFCIFFFWKFRSLAKFGYSLHIHPIFITKLIACVGGYYKIKIIYITLHVFAL